MNQFINKSLTINLLILIFELVTLTNLKREKFIINKKSYIIDDHFYSLHEESDTKTIYSAIKSNIVSRGCNTDMGTNTNAW